MIRFEAVSKRYPDGTVAVDELDLEARSGEITVLVGPSGCGKTTSLRMVNRLIQPTSGRVLLDGVDVASLSQTQLRRGIGYVIQHAGLFPHRTVVDNVATVPVLLGKPRREARREAVALLERVGLDPSLARRYPAQLSGGQQQRVGVARALAADPPVLLMDEPFSAVDPVVRAQLQDELLRLQAELGRRTILFITHDIDEAVKLGDRVAVMRVGGRLAQVATPAELLNRPADTFVSSFLGRDRGYRALGFTPVGRLPLADEPVAVLGTRLDDVASRARGGWLLAVDDDRHPQGWLAPGDPRAARGVTVTPDLLHLGGTLAEAGGSLRSALDAALSSPSGRGVVVDGEGRFVGTVLPHEVLAVIEREAEAMRAIDIRDLEARVGEAASAGAAR